MALHLIFLAMLLAAILAVLLPLARGTGRGGSAGVSALDLHRLRLAEIARDRERGLLDEASAEAARNEAARLLSAERGCAKARAPPCAIREANRQGRRHGAVGSSPSSRFSACPRSFCRSMRSWARREFPRVLSARRPESSARADLTSLIGQVEAHLVEHPRGWQRLRGAGSDLHAAGPLWRCRAGALGGFAAPRRDARSPRRSRRSAHRDGRRGGDARGGRGARQGAFARTQACESAFPQGRRARAGRAARRCGGGFAGPSRRCASRRALARRRRGASREADATPRRQGRSHRRARARGARGCDPLHGGGACGALA